jgi:drug/metabolite transporter (DMT)-like permease
MSANKKGIGKGQPPWGALLLALFAVVVWGASFAVTRVTVREIPPMTLAFVRFLLAGVVLWPVAHRAFRTVKIQSSDRWGVCGLGIFGVSLYFAFENYSLKYTTASHGALIIATIPLATELAHALAVRRRPSLTVLGGSLVALLGVVLLLGADDGEASLLGDLLMFGAVGCWIGYTFLADRLVRRYPNLLLTFLIMLIGTATLLPFAMAEAAFGLVALPSATAWAGVVFLGIFCSAIAYLFWNRALPELGIPTTNALLYGIPLVGVFTGIIALDEPLTANIVLGLILIPGGVLLAGYRSFRRSPKSQVPGTKSEGKS